MGVLKKLLAGIGVLIALVIIAGFFLPKEFSVERTVVIDAHPKDIYPHIVDLKAWQQWGVWFTRDPDMVISYQGPDRAIGMRSQWQSVSEGSGEMEITQLDHNKQVVYRLYFPEFDMGSTGTLTLTPDQNGTVVSWKDEGGVGNNPIDRYFVLFMDDLIGPDFELGLENLKTVVENQH
ncbi:polyketide cyclase [Alteromonas sp. 345S023]|uniref:Polyketide cyclase n=1 Tax=Alteromonas profundi TaxID=2696062 RepID=A0A7X5LIH6_9ALTE|nr:SRPBCC family protein [Alteromonas profundi]NDV89992.1 polyketide cyclase [Alteromonas profundi]